MSTSIEAAVQRNGGEINERREVDAQAVWCEESPRRARRETGFVAWGGLPGDTELSMVRLAVCGRRM
jgi:hypothetical protein